MINPVLWFRSSIRRKAIASLLLLLLSAVFLIGLSIVSWARHFIVDEAKRLASSTSRFVVNDISGLLVREAGKAEAVKVMGRACSDPSVLYALLLGGDGEILASSCTTVRPDEGNSLPLSELYSLDEDSPGFHQYKDVLEVYRLVPGSQKKSPVFFLMGFDIADVHTIIARVTRLIALNGFVVYIVGLMVLLTAVNRLAGPLDTLTEGIKGVGSGTFPEPLKVEGHDEIASLSAAFNSMMLDLESSRKEIEEYHQHLEDKVKKRTAALDRANEELVRTNRSLQEANEKLLELDKLKSNFLGIATHELKTPLTVVEGYLEGLQDGFAGELTSQQSGIVNETLESCYRMGNLISDMLDLTKIESGKMPMERADVPFMEILEKVTTQMAPIAGKRDMSLDVDSGSLAETVYCDRERIAQVLVNLIGNSIKFSRTGGKVFVYGKKIKTAGRDDLAVSVRDTGIGIGPEDLPRIFEEFAQVGSPGKEEGTGLGLAICRRIVEAHGGEITVESEPDSGSVFTFSIPIAKDQSHHRVTESTE